MKSKNKILNEDLLNFIREDMSTPSGNPVPTPRVPETLKAEEIIPTVPITAPVSISTPSGNVPEPGVFTPSKEFPKSDPSGVSTFSGNVPAVGDDPAPAIGATPTPDVQVEIAKATEDSGFMSSPYVQKFLDTFAGAKEAVMENPTYAVAGVLGGIIGSYGIYKLVQMYRDYKNNPEANVEPASVTESVDTLHQIEIIGKSMKHCNEVQKYASIKRISELTYNSLNNR